jgi:hypothetical protein
MDSPPTRTPHSTAQRRQVCQEPTPALTTHLPCQEASLQALTTTPPLNMVPAVSPAELPSATTTRI